MPSKFKRKAVSPTTKGMQSLQGGESGARVVYWFRTDLRLHDSPALAHALSLSPSRLIPLWTWDPHYVFRQRGSANRWAFLVDCMTDLSESLTKINPKQKLHVVRSAPGRVFGALLKKWKIDVLVFERDTDAYGRMRDEEVTKIAENLGVKVVSVSGRTLFDSDELVRQNGGKPTMTIHQVVKAAEKIGDGKPNRPLDAPESLPDPSSAEEMDLSDLEMEVSRADHQGPAHPGGAADGGDPDDYNAVQRTLGERKNTQFSCGLTGPDNSFSVPTLEEMGIDPADATSPHKGGETVGLALLTSHIANEEYVGTFEKPATAPTAFDPRATTLLSPHMHFGSVSVRKFWWDVQDVLQRRRVEKKKNSGEPVNLPGQLLFRDMYFAAHAKVGFAFGQAVGNPVARFIPWHLQSNYQHNVSSGTYVVDDPQAEEYFRRWKEGRTGFPWIDALMRQLKQEGWIHHLGRHAVACFLTRGGCYVSWERGAEVFEEWLIDHEVACNAGNWMWLSCTAFFSQFYRCYSPVAFPKKWDPEGAFVRRYVPELANFDKKYVYEPHKAPIADQKSWGCMIKGDGGGEGGNNNNSQNGNIQVYPKPMFDFNTRRQFCIDKMKEAYDVGLYGDDERVLSGEWKKMFDHDDTHRQLKEEANGTLGSGCPRRGDKRQREDGDDEEKIENGDHDHGDADEQLEQVSRQHRTRNTRAVKKQDTAQKGKQRTLDAMVTREKGQKM
jgi:cryptochrome